MNMFQTSGTKEKGWQQIQRIDNLLNARTGRGVRITAPLLDAAGSAGSYDKLMQVLFSDCRIGNFHILPDSHKSHLGSTIKRIKGRLNQAADDRVVFVEMSTPGRRDSPRIVCFVNAVIDTYFKGIMHCDRLVRPDDGSASSSHTTVLLFAFSRDIKAMKDRSDDGVLDFLRQKLDPTLLRGLPFVSRIDAHSDTGFTVLEDAGISPCGILEINLDICDKHKRVKVANDCQAGTEEEETDNNDDDDGGRGAGGGGGGVGYLRSFEYILLAFRNSPLWRHLRIDDPRIAEETLGIEAARQVLVEQLSTLLGGVGLRHLTLLADIMTVGGSLAPMDQKGEVDDGYVLGHACFGRSSVALVKGLLNRHKDVLQSTDARIMMGLPPNLGHTKSLFEVRSVLAIKPKPSVLPSSPAYSPSSPAYAYVPYSPSHPNSPLYVPYSPSHPEAADDVAWCLPNGGDAGPSGDNKRKRKAELTIE
jgi:hypothetical protein